MRQFVVVGHDVPTEPDFSLDDLTGAGRLDLLCRCVGAALFTSHGVRTDARVHLVLRDEVTVSFDGAEIRGLHPGERPVAGQVRAALEETGAAIGHREVEVSPGLTVSTRGLEPVLEAASGTVVQLHEDGDPAGAVAPPSDPIFVLSDHHDFDPREADVLADAAERRLSLGPTAVHADHAIAVAHNYCDTDGYDPGVY